MFTKHYIFKLQIWNHKFNTKRNKKAACSLRGTEYSHIRFSKHIINQYIENDISETFIVAPNIDFIKLLQTELKLSAEVWNNREKQLSFQRNQKAD